MTTHTDRQERFGIVNRSVSGHCCFDYTVVDYTKPVVYHGVPYTRDGEPQHEPVCECFDLDQAEMVCKALNGRTDK